MDPCLSAALVQIPGIRQASSVKFVGEAQHQDLVRGAAVETEQQCGTVLELVAVAGGDLAVERGTDLAAVVRRAVIGLETGGQGGTEAPGSEVGTAERVAAI